MDLDDGIPILILRILEADIPEDPRVVDEHIDPPKRLDGSLDDPVAVLDAVVVRDRLAASGFDLVDDDISRLGTDISIPPNSGNEGCGVDLPLRIGPLP